MTFRTGVVCNDTRNLHAGPPVGKTADERRNASRHPFGVDHKNDGNPQFRRDFGGRPLHRTGNSTVKKSHHTLDNRDTRGRRKTLPVPSDRLFSHHPAIQIDRLRPGSPAVKRRVDIIGSAFERRHAETATVKRAHQCERNRCLAAPGIDSGYQKSGKLSAEIRHTSPDTPVMYTSVRSGQLYANSR